MKSKIAILALIAASALQTLPAHANGYRHDCGQAVYDCPVVRVCTHELCRHSFCRTSYDACGCPITIHFTVVSFQDEFSDGSVRNYTRTFRS